MISAESTEVAGAAHDIEITECFFTQPFARAAPRRTAWIIRVIRISGSRRPPQFKTDSGVRTMYAPPMLFRCWEFKSEHPDLTSRHDQFTSPTLVVVGTHMRPSISRHAPNAQISAALLPTTTHVGGRRRDFGDSPTGV